MKANSLCSPGSDLQMNHKCTGWQENWPHVHKSYFHLLKQGFLLYPHFLYTYHPHSPATVSAVLVSQAAQIISGTETTEQERHRSTCRKRLISGISQCKRLRKRHKCHGEGGHQSKAIYLNIFTYTKYASTV